MIGAGLVGVSSSSGCPYDLGRAGDLSYRPLDVRYGEVQSAPGGRAGDPLRLVRRRTGICACAVVAEAGRIYRPPSPLLPYDLLLHGAPKPTDLPMVKHARRVFAANHAIADTLSRLDIPSRLVPIPPLLDETHDPIRLLSFGMAHKLTRHHYAHVRDLLGDRPYEVELSVLVHEGQPWGGLLQRAHDSMREVFGDRARVQGSLSDGALRQRLRSATYALLFYPGGVRSNNTTMWAALQEGAHLITNLDPWSPAALTHGVNCYDVTRLTRWPDHPPCACHIPTLAQTVEVLCEP